MSDTIRPARPIPLPVATLGFLHSQAERLNSVPFFDRLKVVLALLDDEGAEVTEHDVRPLLAEAESRALSRLVDRDAPLSSRETRLLRVVMDIGDALGLPRPVFTTLDEVEAHIGQVLGLAISLPVQLAALRASSAATSDIRQEQVRRAREALAAARALPASSAQHSYALGHLAAILDGRA